MGCDVYRVIKPWLSHALSVCSPPLLANIIHNLIVHYPKLSNEMRRRRRKRESERARRDETAGSSIQLWIIIRPRGKFNGDRSNPRARVDIYIPRIEFILLNSRVNCSHVRESVSSSFRWNASMELYRDTRTRACRLEKSRVFHFCFSLRYLCESLLSSRMKNACLIVVIIRCEY